MKPIIMMHANPLAGKSVRAIRIKKALKYIGIDADIVKSVATRYKDKSRHVRFTKDQVDETIEKTKMEKDKAYADMIPLAEDALKLGRVPIMDASHHIRYRRKWVYDLARKLKTKVIVIDLTYTDTDTIKAELRRRAENFDMRENILHKFDQYKMMADQDEPVTDEEITQSSAACLRYNRDKDELNLINCQEDNKLISLIIKSIKNF